MKTNTIILAGFCIVALSILLSSFIQKSSVQNTRTEEYAIVDVIEDYKTKTIRVTKGTQPATDEVWKKEKTEIYEDYTPTIKILNQLNAEGYELVNASLAYTTMSGKYSLEGGNPRHTFVMVKKLR